ncbi:hypothetical protein DPSP01_000367 [Paraphaeosphaeria sporulosa]|uniref:Tho complex subunit 7/Mft1p n=1 Tax=Paraphaeosphaeria sporulosa TaxID=1460663 RepID=A0A177C9S3_9PLEO|nr:uncharacterized protein CC84DRAFT_840975 [Paraphaeosphaeria sporulosa]OAG03470.1 hypothetical protein CC84DRAFT_840975 [Paraphaeosphaeria sporulosa]
MAPKLWPLLPQSEEDALHNVSRLFNVESRPYARVAHRIITSREQGKPTDFILSDARPRQLPTPPPDASAADEEAAGRDALRKEESDKIEAWRKELINELELLDFATLRFELTTGINNEERERYAKEKLAITDKQDHVRKNIEKLRVDLEQAKETLAVRKTYDELTKKITDNKMLKPRDEQAIAHEKLDQEIAELEQEVQNAKATWGERRTQFNRIETEAMNLMQMIKDEKEEAERKEGMRDDEGDDKDASTRADVSHAGTPRPDGGLTPVHPSQTAESSNTLKVPPQDRLSALSVAASPAPSGAGEDTEMGESGDNAGRNPADDSEIEEGEDVEEGEHEGSERGEASGREMDES